MIRPSKIPSPESFASIPPPVPRQTGSVRLKILLFDCRDSFTQNLAQAMDEIVGPRSRLDVIRHDAVDLAKAAEYDRIVLSPGPGIPGETLNLIPLIRRLAPRVPILGVCLGHQALAEAFGGRLLNLKNVFHGIKSKVKILAKDRLFAGLPDEIEGGRYHSWVVDRKGLPKELEVTAEDADGRIMGISHRLHEAHGVQFHPESILTPVGPLILKNFLFL
ncbi:MAG: aminodeoxychorismate/anthranilate synthase component II [Deltaproteobacteria bacterium]|nr:aminodeoxychorismate/anthranilate synthase component II [Deltaproteobacteria bacterium]